MLKERPRINYSSIRKWLKFQGNVLQGKGENDLTLHFPIELVLYFLQEKLKTLVLVYHRTMYRNRKTNSGFYFQTDGSINSGLSFKKKKNHLNFICSRQSLLLQTFTYLLQFSLTVYMTLFFWAALFGTQISFFCS